MKPERKPPYRESIRYTYDKSKSNGKVVGFNWKSAQISGMMQVPVYESTKIEIIKAALRKIGQAWASG